MAEAPTQAQIVAKLNDASLAPWTRARLVKQLPAVGHRDSLPVLADLLSDPDQAIRLAALGAIRNVGGPPAVDLLVNALRHEDQTTALWATQRLRQLNYLGAGPQILAIAQERWPSLNDDTRTSFVMALTGLRQQEAIPLLKVGVMSSDRALRRHSANALACVGTIESREVLDWALSELSRSQARAVRSGMRSDGPLLRLLKQLVRRFVDN